MNILCNHEILYMEEVLNKKTGTYTINCRCVLCGKEFKDVNLEDICSYYIISANTVLANGQKSHINFKTLQECAKQINDKYYLFNGHNIPVKKLYNELLQYFGIK